jgi:mannose-6-phosphate isomerase-like protein (cupin superfamily)
MATSGSKIINIRTGQEMTFLLTRKDTDGEFLKIECYSPVSGLKEPVHLHPLQTNRFTITSGELTFWINGVKTIAKPGDTITIPRKTPHHFWNSGNQGAHYIQEFFPAGNIEDLFSTFFALARDKKLNKAGIPNLFRTSVIMLSHQNDIRLVKPAWRTQKLIYSVTAPIGRALGFKAKYI